MNDSYDIPSEPRLSNSLHLNRPTPQSRTKMKQKKRSPPLPPDVTPFLSLDDTVPLDGELMIISFIRQFYTGMIIRNFTIQRSTESFDRIFITH